RQSLPYLGRRTREPIQHVLVTSNRCVIATIGCQSHAQIQVQAWIAGFRLSARLSAARLSSTRPFLSISIPTTVGSRLARIFSAKSLLASCKPATVARLSTETHGPAPADRPTRVSLFWSTITSPENVASVPNTARATESTA